MAIAFRLNGRRVSFDGDASMPLLWYLRDHAGLTGTKFGCGVGACGACTVHVNGRAARACNTAVSTLADREVVTVEGLAGGDGGAGGGSLHAVQEAWIEEDVPQCGYCQAGQIMAAVDLLRRTPHPTDAEIGAISNLCRCGTYPRIRKAIHRAAESLARRGTR